MKLTQGLSILAARNPNKKISKKILLANTQDKLVSDKILKKADGVSSDPLFNSNQVLNGFNPDIRYRNTYNYSPLVGINYRNDLLIFAENTEIKKAVNIVANETAIIDVDAEKYPVAPYIDITKIEDSKQKTAKAIDDYLMNGFYPKLLQMYNFKDEQLIEIIDEFLITGKICYEIIYDNIKNPKEIIGMMPLDPATIQKVKSDQYVYFIQQPVGGGDSHERVLHENQVVLVEWNKFDFGYVSYVDKLRRSFNIMRSMQTSKILWFAAKSQLRMHIKLALGDVGSKEAQQKLIESKNQYTNQFAFREDGIVTFNNQPNNNAYREFFTGETATSGHPEIEEINANGTDLSETDSLSFWAKQYWQETEIPYDRIDPNASEGWGFADVNNLRKVEINFAKFINRIRKMFNPLFIKPIIIQLTLKEVEIGIDLELLDNIKIKWVAFNQYESLAELELLSKRIELANNISQFGDLEDVNGNVRKMIPISWVMRNQLNFSEDQIKSIEKMRRKEQAWLGFDPDETTNYTDESLDLTNKQLDLTNKSIEISNEQMEIGNEQMLDQMGGEELSEEDEEYIDGDDEEGIEESDNSEY
jgi:hypothetical protein